MKSKFLYLNLLALLFIGCIGDDFIDDRVDPVLRLDGNLESLAVNDTHDFDAIYLNDIGMPEEVQIEWSSSDVTVASVDQDGLVTGHSIGSVTIGAAYAEGMLEASDTFDISDDTVVEMTARSGSLQTTSSYLLQGDFTLESTDAGLSLSFDSNYAASTSLPGLYVYLTNNPNSTNGAYEIGSVTTFNGAHSYTLPSSVGLNEYSHVLYFCAPFNVKVGDGQLNP